MRGLSSFLSNRFVRIVVIALLSLPVWASSFAPAHAVTFTVNTGADETITDGNCSLREAILSATTFTGVDGCPVGTGNDLITFAGGIKPVVTSPLPAITGKNIVTIYGGELMTSLIDHSSGNLFTVNSGGTLTVHSVNISGSTGSTCFTSAGKLTLVNEQITACMITVQATGGSVALQKITGEGVDTHTGNVSLTVAESTFSGPGTVPFLFYIGAAGGTITHSTFNDAPMSVDITTTGPLTISRSFLGGSGIEGLLVGGGTTTLTNSIVTNQTNGGVESNTPGQLIVTNSTIMGNKVGIFSNNSSVHLRNTILANNSHDCYAANVVIDEGGNMQLIGDGSCPASIFTGNPLLNGSYAPGVGSHAIDNGLTANCPSNDFYGAARFEDGHCDIGAVEVN